MRIESLWVYPLKGCRGVPVTEAVLEPWGLAGDRRWMVVNADGRFQSQRESPALATVTASLERNSIRVSAEGMEPLVVREPVGGGLVPVRVWKGAMHAVLAAPEGSEWFSELLGADVRMVWLDDPLRRPPREGTGTLATFSDGFPLLVTNTASLDALNDWLVAAGSDPVAMDRFRANLVVDCDEPWAEDEWRELATPNAVLWNAKPCGRCVVPNTDQRTGVRSGHEPLLTLTRHRRIGNKAIFGANMAPRDGSANTLLRVGDALTHT